MLYSDSGKALRATLLATIALTCPPPLLCRFGYVPLKRSWFWSWTRGHPALRVCERLSCLNSCVTLTCYSESMTAVLGWRRHTKTLSELTRWGQSLYACFHVHVMAMWPCVTCICPRWVVSDRRTDRQTNLQHASITFTYWHPTSTHNKPMTLSVWPLIRSVGQLLGNDKQTVLWIYGCVCNLVIAPTRICEMCQLRTAIQKVPLCMWSCQWPFSCTAEVFHDAGRKTTASDF